MSRDLDRYLRELIDEHGHGRESVANHRSTLSQFETQHGPLRQADAGKVNRFIQSAKTQGTKYRRYKEFKRYVAWAVEHGMLQGVWRRVNKVKAPKPAPKPANRRRLDEALDVASRVDQRIYTMLMLACTTGLRRMEVAKLQGEHIDLDAGTIYVKGKGGKEAYVTIIPELRPALVAWLQHRGMLDHHGLVRPGPLFPTDRPVASRNHLCPRRVGDICNDFLHANGLPTSSLHKLRHTFATELAGKPGMTPFLLKLALRHSDMNTMQHYVDISPDVMHEVMRDVQITHRGSQPTPPAPSAPPAGYVSAAEVATIVAQAVAAAMAAQTPAEAPGAVQPAVRRRLRLVKPA